MAAEISWAWETIREDDAVHAAVVQANGQRAFCAGADVRGATSWFFRSNVWNTFDPGVTLSPKSHHRCWKPVVTAVHGIAAGGAQYFLNEADIIIAADDAEFFDPHATMGIVSSLEPIGMLHRGMPLGDVLRWALMGSEERITADHGPAPRPGHRSRASRRTSLPRPPDRRIYRRTEPPGDTRDGAGHLGVARHDACRCAAERHGLHPHREHVRGPRIHAPRAEGTPYLPLSAVALEYPQLSHLFRQAEGARWPHGTCAGGPSLDDPQPAGPRHRHGSRRRGDVHGPVSPLRQPARLRSRRPCALKAAPRCGGLHAHPLRQCDAAPQRCSILERHHGAKRLVAAAPSPSHVSSPRRQHGLQGRSGSCSAAPPRQQGLHTPHGARDVTGHRADRRRTVVRSLRARHG